MQSLTNTDTQVQRFIGTNLQLLRLPTASTLGDISNANTCARYDILNEATNTITIQNNSGTSLGVIPASGSAVCLLTNVASNTWNV